MTTIMTIIKMYSGVQSRVSKKKLEMNDRLNCQQPPNFACNMKNLVVAQKSCPSLGLSRNKSNNLKSLNQER